MGKMKAKHTGSFGAVIKKLKALPNNVDEAAQVALRQTILKGERIAVLHMRNQDLRWRKLKKSYKDSKIKKGLSEKTLIATSTYMQSITSFDAAGYGFVGIRRGVYDKASGMELANLALIHEYGSVSRGIKPRKLWKPTMLELKKWIKESGIFVKSIKKRL